MGQCWIFVLFLRLLRRLERTFFSLDLRLVAWLQRVHTARWWRHESVYYLLGHGPCREQRSRWSTSPFPFRGFSTWGTEWVLALGRVKQKLCNLSFWNTKTSVPEMGISLRSKSSLSSSFLLHTTSHCSQDLWSAIKNVNLPHYIYLGAHVKWNFQLHLISAKREKRNYHILWYLWHIILVFDLC